MENKQTNRLQCLNPKLLNENENEKNISFIWYRGLFNEL